MFWLILGISNFISFLFFVAKKVAWKKKFEKSRWTIFPFPPFNIQYIFPPPYECSFFPFALPIYSSPNNRKPIILSPNNKKEQLPFGANPPRHDSKKVAATILVVIRRNEIPPSGARRFSREHCYISEESCRVAMKDEKTFEGVEGSTFALSLSDNTAGQH